MDTNTARRRPIAGGNDRLHRHEQGWREDAASSWQRSKEGVVFKSDGQCINATLDYLQAVSKNLELVNERFHAQDQRRDGIGILSKSAGAGKKIKTLVKTFFTAAAMSRLKGVERRGSHLAKACNDGHLSRKSQSSDARVLAQISGPEESKAYEGLDSVAEPVRSSIRVRRCSTRVRRWRIGPLARSSARNSL